MHTKQSTSSLSLTAYVPAVCATGLTVETPHDFDISALIPHRTTCQMTCQDPTPDNKLDIPPYELHQAFGLKIYEKTISMSASELQQ